MADPGDRITAELLVDGQWVDISADVRDEDQITITHGRGDERPSLTPSTMELVLNDFGGDDGLGVVGTYRNRNPLSPYYGLLGRNSQVRVAYWPDSVADTFTRTISTGWGATTPGGLAWTAYATAGSTPTDVDVTSGQGTHYIGTASHVRLCALHDIVAAHVDMAVTFACPQATGADLLPSLVYRATDPNTYGHVRAALTTSNTVVLRIFAADKPTPSTFTELGAATVPALTHTGVGQPLRMRVQAIGRSVRARVWIAGGAEPSTWHLEVTDPSAIRAGWIGVRSVRALTNTNTADPQFAFDDFAAQPIDMRAWLEVPEWKPDLDQSGTLATMQLGAAGLLSRLSEGTGQALRSPIYRHVMGTTETADRIAYWPVEDPSGSTMVASAVDAVPAMSIVGRPAFASFDGWPGSDSVATLPDGSSLVGTVVGSITSSAQVSLHVHTPSTEWADGTTIMSVWTSGSTLRYDLRYGTGGTLAVRSYNTSYAQSADSGAQATGLKVDSSYWIAVSVSQVSTNIAWRISVQRISSDLTSLTSWSGTFTSQSFVSVASIKIFPNQNAKGAAVGHITAGRGSTFLSNISAALTGFNREAVRARFLRLCQEAGIDASVIGDAPTRMGVQTSGTLIGTLALCASTDGGTIHDSRNYFGLELRAARSMYNQSAVVLDYDEETIAPALRPVENMSLVANSVTATDPGTGRTATSERATGSMSTAAPPAGIGLYEDPIRASTYQPAELQVVADWRRAHGSYDADRWPGLTIRLHSHAYDDLALRAQVVRLDVGDLIVLRNLPRHYSYDDVRLVLQGYTETISSHTWTLRCNASPGDIWSEIGVYDDPGSRYDSATSSLTSAVSSSATSFSVTTTNPADLWRTGSGLNLNLHIAGEVVTVGTIAGTSSPQTFSNITRAVNGVVKALPANAPVHLAQPARYGL